MNWRLVLVLATIGLLLMVAAVEISRAEDDDKYEIEIAPYNVTVGAKTVMVNPGDTIYWNGTYDMRIFGWPGTVYEEEDEYRLIDITSYPVRIFIDPKFWVPGEYHTYMDEDEEHGNTLAFFIAKDKEEVVKNATTYPEYTGINQSKVFEPYLPLERKYISDILVARGDMLVYSHPAITNLTTFWMFGARGGLYAKPCYDGNVTIAAAELNTLETGSYTVLLLNPGKNTVPEALYNDHREEIYSPFIGRENISMGGMGPVVMLPKFLAWLEKYSDDAVLKMDLQLEQPHIELAGIDMQYFNIDSLRVSGYTNLANESEIYITIDENNESAKVKRQKRYSTTALSISAGEMRQFTANVPFDETNITIGMHTVWAHGNYSALVIHEYYVYHAPEGQVTPVATVKYIGGNLFVPTPTPEVKEVEKVVTQEVIKVVTREVTPKPEVVRKEQEDALYGLMGWVARLVVLVIVVISGVIYARSVYIRRWKK